MLRKLLIVILISILSFPVFSETVTIDREKYLALTTQLQESTELLIKASNKIKELKGIIEENLITISDNTTLLNKAKKRIESDQIEIKTIRKDLKKAIDGLADKKYLRAGIAVTYPYGGQVAIMGDIPKIPVSVFGDFGIFKSNNNLELYVGLGIAFRF